jgi:hypothetical protein
VIQKHNKPFAVWRRIGWKDAFTKVRKLQIKIASAFLAAYKAKGLMLP